jgi:hypothetical protein
MQLIITVRYTVSILLCAACWTCEYNKGDLKWKYLCVLCSSLTTAHGLRQKMHLIFNSENKGHVEVNSENKSTANLTLILTL